MTFDLIGEHQKTKGFTSGKSFCRLCSQTLFFGGKKTTTGNTSAVRRPAVVMFVKKNNQAGTKLREQAQKQKMPLDDVELRSIK